jgi:hypothetical protein
VLLRRRNSGNTGLVIGDYCIFIRVDGCWKVGGENLPAVGEIANTGDEAG